MASLQNIRKNGSTADGTVVPRRHRITRRETGFSGGVIGATRATRQGIAAIAMTAALMMAGCGHAGAPSSAGGAPSPLPAPVPAVGPARITITSAGVSPAEVTIAAGAQVTFINNDTQPHDVAGGPDLEHPDCREIDAVGFLSPGQSRQTAPLSLVRTCDYHDHQNHSPIFNGRIIIR
jgi:plastocyanin